MKKILKEIRDIDLLLQIVKDTEVKLNLLSQQKTAVEDLQVELNKKLVSIYVIKYLQMVIMQELLAVLCYLTIYFHLLTGGLLH